MEWNEMKRKEHRTRMKSEKKTPIVIQLQNNKRNV